MVLEVPQLFNPPYDGYNGLHELTIPDDVTDLAYIESAMVKGMSKQQSVLSSSVAGVPNLKLSVNDMIEVEFENTFRHPVQSICLVSMHNILITLLNNGLTQTVGHTDGLSYRRTDIQTDRHEQYKQLRYNVQLCQGNCGQRDEEERARLHLHTDQLWQEGTF